MSSKYLWETNDEYETRWIDEKLPWMFAIFMILFALLIGFIAKYGDALDAWFQSVGL